MPQPISPLSKALASRRMTLAGVVAAGVLAFGALAGCSSSNTVGSAAGSGPAGGGIGSGSGSGSGQSVGNVTEDAALNAMLPASIKSAGSIKVATNIPYPPWEMYATAGGNQPAGIDYDLSQALAAKLGIKASFDQTAFDSMVPALQAGREDIIMAGLWDNKEREQALSFVDYAKDGYGLLVKAGNPDNINSVDDLAGKSVAIQSGTSQLQVLDQFNADAKKAHKPQITILPFPQDADAILAVQSGKAVAQLDGLAVASYTAKTFGGGGAFQLTGSSSVSSIFGSGIVGIGVPKSDSQLLTAVRKAMLALASDGTYQKILDQYGVSALAMPTMPLNTGGK